MNSNTPVKKTKQRNAADWFTPAAVFALLLIATLVALMFKSLMKNYDENVTTESSSHLEELNYQIARSVEDRIENDWLMARTAARCVEECGDDTVFELMDKLKVLWNISNVTFYTEDGGSISSDGGKTPNDLASERVNSALEQGGSMTILEHRITYTVPVETGLSCGGSRVVAVSLDKSMRTFLEDMDCSTFGGAAYIYLSEASGRVISRLLNGSAPATYNVLALIAPDAGRASLDTASPAVRMENGMYIVLTPVQTSHARLLLAYFVPVSAVNKTANNYTRSVTVTSLVVLSLFGACSAFAVIYLNRIRRRQYDSALLARERMFDLLAENSRTAFGLFGADEAPAYISVNSAEVVGERAPRLCRAGKGYELRNSAGETEAFSQLNDGLHGWDGGAPFRSGFVLNPSGGNYYEIQLLPVAGERGRFIGIAQDVTLLHEREAALKHALLLAERASEAKSRFLSNMSHDIRTPMNAIVNMADFAAGDMDDPEKLRRHLATIRQSSDHLLMLINDILDMSRIESGSATIDIAPFDILAELERLKSITLPLCEARRQKLTADFSGVRVSGVLGDQVKVSQILMNLLSNAVKFTPEQGCVNFIAEQTPGIRENYATLRFIVSDTGMGIAPDFLPHIFEPFTRADAKRVSSVQGTGLGLSICHSYVIAMGGSIKCESEPGRGSVFTAELSFEKAASAPERPVEAAGWDERPFADMRCLLCEDNPTNREIARTLLENLGFEVDAAADGSEGFARFEASPEGRYDVIYMDVQMPVMDGYEAAAAIRKCAHPQAKRVPIIAMTANVFIEDVEKVRLAGMDGHVGKPVNIPALSMETGAVLARKREL